MSINPTWQKFQRATMALARSSNIKERLEHAYREHLSLINEDELPKDIRGDFRDICASLTRVRPALRDEDTCRATVRKLSNTEAEDIASAIVLLFGAVPRATPSVRKVAQPAAPPPKIAQVVPLFLADVQAG